MTDDCVNTKKFPANQEIDWENDAKYSSLTDDNELKVIPSSSANGSPKTVGDSDDEDYPEMICFDSDEETDRGETDSNNGYESC